MISWLFMTIKNMTHPPYIINTMIIVSHHQLLLTLKACIDTTCLPVTMSDLHQFRVRELFWCHFLSWRTSWNKSLQTWDWLLTRKTLVDSHHTLHKAPNVQHTFKNLSTWGCMHHCIIGIMRLYPSMLIVVYQHLKLITKWWQFWGIITTYINSTFECGQKLCNVVLLKTNIKLCYFWEVD
jgi:hypothetical protein